MSGHAPGQDTIALLREAQQPVAEREYLESCEFFYGSGWPEPSPAEWGIQAGYQQTIEAMPHEQFLEDVEAFHRTNREDDDGSGQFLTLANRIRAAIAKAEQP